MVLKLDSRLKASFEHDMAQRHEVRDSDIHYSRLSGMDPRDVDVFCDFTYQRGLLMIVRCPKRPARHFHGKADPKPSSIRKPTDPATGLLLSGKGKAYVSDYDLMCVWRYFGAGHYEKIFFSELGLKGLKALPPAARELFDDINQRLVSPLQHGAQDDYHAPDNPGVALRQQGAAMPSRFMVFNLGAADYVCNGTELKACYERLLGKMAWPYDADGKFRG
jgi:hypothetical protein